MTFYHECIVCNKSIEGGMFCSLAHYAEYEKNKEKYNHKVEKEDGGTKKGYTYSGKYSGDPGVKYLDGWPGEDDERDYLGVPTVGRGHSSYSEEGMIRRIGRAMLGHE